MFQQQCQFVKSYLQENFLQAIDRFEELVVYTADQSNRVKYLQPYTGTNDKLLNKKIKQLCQGFNQLSQVRLTILRILKNSEFIFLFVKENLPKETQENVKNERHRMIADKSPVFYCIIVTSLYGFQSSEKMFDVLGTELTSSANIAIQQPYMEMELINDLIVIRSLPENVVIQRKKQNWCKDINEVKQYGNQAFSLGRYFQAFIIYQFALSCCHQISQDQKRSILYSNSSACFFKMGLYDSCIKYSSIAIRINSNYEKSYVRKINGLLQKKVFSEIPALLMALLKKQQKNYMQEMNKKYSVYLANSLGMYNWMDIMSGKDEVACYQSKKIGLRIEGDRYAYYALQPIKSYEFLMMNKAMISIKKPKTDKLWDDLYEQISKCTYLQKSFGSVLKALPCQKYPNGGNPTNNKFLTKEEAARKLKRSLVQYKSFLNAANERQSMGIWTDLFKFSHRCRPNCTWVHIRGLLCISTVQEIKKGQTLTIDYIYNTKHEQKRAALLQKHGIFCKCQYCQIKPLKYPPTQQVIEQIKQKSDDQMKKIAIWKIIQNTIEQKQMPSNQLIKIYVQAVNCTVTWNDMINLLKILYKKEQISTQKSVQKKLEKQENVRKNSSKEPNSSQVKSKKERNLFVESMLAKGLSILLKIPKRQAFHILQILL